MANTEVSIGGWKCSVSDEGQYLYVSRTGSPGEVHIKADNEGLVVDLWAGGEDPECVATAAATYEEMSNGDLDVSLTHLYGDTSQVSVYFTADDVARIRNMRQALFDNASGENFHPSKVRLVKIGAVFDAEGYDSGEFDPCVEIVLDDTGIHLFWRATKFGGIEDHFGGQFSLPE